MHLFKNIKNLVTMKRAFEKQARFILQEDLSILKDQALLVDRGLIKWIGKSNKVPNEFYKKITKETDVKSNSILPGWVECHTHSVFAGNRADEFEMRNQGATYQEITAKGGGIHSTVKAVRNASLEKLKSISQSHVNNFVSQGVTTLEIKSGYGLDQKNEIKMLEVIQKLKGPEIIATFLGAHAIPKEFKDSNSKKSKFSNKISDQIANKTVGSSDQYIELIINKMLPLVRKKNLAARVDIFIEKGFFSKEQGYKLLSAAKNLNFDCVIHADQLSLSGGTDLAVKMNALSADHVIQVSDEQISSLAKSNVTAVLLPSADLYMKCKYPPARKMIDAGVRVALATDFNPGSSPSQNLNLVGLLARLEMKMTLPEVISAYTVGGALALNLKDRGVVAEGFKADFQIIDCDWQELFYSVGVTNTSKVYRSGKLVYKS